MTPEERRHRKRAQHACRHHENDGDRNRPGFIQCGKAEEHDEQRQRVKRSGRLARHLFLIGNAVPFDREPARELARDLFNRLHSRTGGNADSRVTLNVHGRIRVEALQTRRT